MSTGSVPLAVDLCCGLGGWTLGLQAAGWRVAGYDVDDFGGRYPGEYFVRQDVRTISGHALRRAGVRLIVASPPCQEFSYRSFPFRRCKALPPPALGVELFRACERIGREAGVPYVVENVRGAVPWVGQPAMHLGSFYLWGTGLPALWPVELRRVVKGLTRASPPGEAPNHTAGRRMGKTNPQDIWRNRGGSCDGRRYSGTLFEEMDRLGRPSRSARNRRREWSARIAMIPFELARTVGETHYCTCPRVTP